jgi:hypothetical protein
VAAVMIAEGLARQNGDDLRRDPLEVRKATLRSMLAKAGLGIRFNEHLEGDGPTVFAHACDGARRHRVEAEGLALPLRAPAGSAEMKTPNAPAVTREAEGGLEQSEVAMTGTLTAN